MPEIGHALQPPTPPSRRGHLAIVSLVAGLLFCIPPGSIVAIVCGIRALRSKQPQVGGRTAAWAGIILALPGLAMIGWFIYTSYWLAAPATHFTETFIRDLSAGHTDVAMSKCDSAIAPEEIARWVDEVQSLGTPINVQCTTPVYQTTVKGNERRFTFAIDATVTGPTGKSRTIGFGLLRSAGVFRVWSLE